MARFKDKELLISTINKKGFLLEDKTAKVLSDIAHHLHKPHTVNYKDERVEFDIIAEIGSKICIIECKHTDYSWIFTKSPDNPKVINLMKLVFENDNNILVKIGSRSTSDFQTARSNISVMINEVEGGYELAKTNNKDVQTSYKDVNDAINQVLKELTAYFYVEIPQRVNIDTEFTARTKYLVPIIVTNAKLFYLDYEEKDLDNKGDLVDLKDPIEVDSIIYNYSIEIGFEIKDDMHNYITKSVFIVNVEKLRKEILTIIDQNMYNPK